jgi:carbon starvation protein
MINSLWIAFGVIIAFVLAYVFYSRYVGDKILGLDPARKTPAHLFNDGLDFVPSRREVLFGHHFASIAGLGPIVGPAIAVIWGWVPALLWIVLGAIFLGAVHDFTTLFLSIRHNGISIGALAEKIISRRARVFFLFLIFFILSLAMGVFANKVAILFSLPMEEGGQPDAVIPVFSLIAIAILIGSLFYKVRRIGLLIPTLVGVALMLGSIYLGVLKPVTGISFTRWVFILLIYTYFASILPVWLLLQPRDYINSYQLYIGLFLIYAGLIVFHPQIAAQPVHQASHDAPSMFPFLFIIVACGAISGFHNLVSSGTTARQLFSEKDSRIIGYGGMLMEGLLAVGVLLACTAALGDKETWLQTYSDWSAVNRDALSNFISGAGEIMSHLGIPSELARVFTAVVCVAFAMTTLDTATRLLRYNIEEIGKSFGSRFLAGILGNRFVASGIAVLSIGYFAMMKVQGKSVGAILWQLFGTSNQLLAGLGLLIVTLYLIRRQKNFWITLIPMILVISFTGTAMIIKLQNFYTDKNWTVFGVGIAILVLAIWMMIEAVIALRKYLKARTAAEIQDD